MFINKRNKPFIFHGFQNQATIPTSFKVINYELEQLFLSKSVFIYVEGINKNV